MGLLDKMRVSWDKDKTPSRKVVRSRREESAVRSKRNENIRNILKASMKSRDVKGESLIKIIWYKWILGKSIPRLDVVEDLESPEEKAKRRAEEKEEIVFLPDAEVKKFEKQRASASAPSKPVKKRSLTEADYESAAEQMRGRTHPRRE